MHFRAPLRLISVVSACAVMSGQQQAEVTQRDAPFTFSTGVNLVLVPVVVRDREGHAIGTLKKEDFQLFDKGKLQEISKFSIEKAEAPPTLPDTSIQTDASGNPQAKPGGPAAQPIAGHFIMWLFDDMHLSFGDLAQTRVAAKRVLKESFALGTRAAIYTTSGHTSLDFTDDLNQLDATLDQIKPWPTIPTDAAARPCLDVSYFQADRIINASDQQALLAADSDFLNCPEAATLVAEANASARQTGQTPNLQAAVATPVRMAVLKELEIGIQDTRNTLLALKGLVRRMSAMPGTRTIVMVSPGFYLINAHRTDEMDVINNAIRNNVVIRSLDARGLYSLTPGGNADTAQANLDPNTMTIKANYERETALANRDVLEELADDTGGSFFKDSNDFASGLKQLATQPEYIYILGFAPQKMKLDGSYHKLNIVLKNGAGLQMQARRGYFERNHLEDPAEEAKEELTEAFFSRDEMRELPVVLSTQYFKTGDLKARLAILARIDAKHLHYRKTDGHNDDTLTVVGGVFDQNGNYVVGTQKVVDLKFRDQTLDALPEGGITVKTNLDVASGSYIVRLVVRDSEGKVMSALNSAVVIP
ncbi:MAG TPA: VWA domain-containing protein [Bryobacteraceae bacterium]|nr:VWA domain-containing protein [Bryobacteraceae bacterium]